MSLRLLALATIGFLFSAHLSRADDFAISIPIQLTHAQNFDPAPSPDGKKLVFASNRNAAKTGDTNVFIADWVK